MSDDIVTGQPAGDRLALRNTVMLLAGKEGCGIYWPAWSAVDRDALPQPWLIKGCVACNFEMKHELPISLEVDVAHLVPAIATILNEEVAVRCECVLGELLPNRAMTPEERAAYDEDPRPGVWVGDDDADGRELTQDQTDALIRYRLHDAFAANRLDGRPLLGEPPQDLQVGIRYISQGMGPPIAVDTIDATRQRGGIDSDPMVRLLAYRAWGDRDRLWFTRNV